VDVCGQAAGNAEVTWVQHRVRRHTRIGTGIRGALRMSDRGRSVPGFTRTPGKGYIVFGRTSTCAWSTLTNEHPFGGKNCAEQQ